jgi:ketosteroid isomerase-like protein
VSALTVSEQNLWTIEAIFTEFTRRESDLTFRAFDDEITWDARPLHVPAISGVYHGHEGVREFWRTWYDAWERIDVVEGPDHRAHGNQVVSWHRQRNRGKGSGITVEQEGCFVWTFLDGRIVHVALYLTREELYRAAGLEP